MLRINYQGLLNTNKKQHLVFLVLLIISIASTGIFISDMFVPSLPAIQKALNTSPHWIKLTIALYLAGTTLTQLVYGPLSDRYGRRPVLFLGLSIAFIGSCLCISAHSIQLLLVGRLIQGAGMGVGPTLSRSIARDVFCGEQLIKVISYLSLGIGMAPALSPVIGGYISLSWGWHGVFVAMALIVGSCFLLTAIFLPETNHTQKPTSFHGTLKNYRKLLNDRIFICALLNNAMMLSACYVYYTESPFIIQQQMGFSIIQFADFALLTSCMIVLGRFINVWISPSYRVQSFKFGVHAGFVFALLLVSLTFMAPKNIYTLLLPVSGLLLCSGIVSSNAASLALNRHANIAGTTAGLYGCLQLLMTFLFCSIASMLPSHGPLTLGLLLCTCTALGVFSFHWGALGTLRLLHTEETPAVGR